VYAGALKRPGWPRQIVLSYVPAGGSGLLVVGVAAVRGDVSLLWRSGSSGYVGQVRCTVATGLSWEDSGLPSRGKGVLVTQVYWEVNPKGRSCCAFGSRRLKVGARLVLETRSRCM